MFRFVLNVIWLVLAGVELAIAYGLAGVAMMITIIGIPFGIQALKLAGFALWPFGRVVVLNPSASSVASGIGNIIWLILAGWWLALVHIVTGLLLCVTLIGTPMGIASFKMVGLALWPFGRSIVSRSALESLPPGSYVVGPTTRALPPGTD